MKLIRVGQLALLLALISPHTRVCVEIGESLGASYGVGFFLFLLALYGGIAWIVGRVARQSIEVFQLLRRVK